MKRWIEVSILALILGAMIVAFLLVYRQNHPAPVPGVGPMELFDGEVDGIRFNFPSSYQSTAITEDAKKVGTIFRATKGSDAVIAVRRESGLGVVKLAGGSILDALKRSLDRYYPSQYPGYEKQTLEDITVGAEQGVRYEFTYNGTDSATKVRQQLNILVVRDADAYMISLQAPDAEFDVHRAEFQTVLDSIKFSEPVSVDESTKE